MYKYFWIGLKGKKNACEAFGVIVEVNPFTEFKYVQRQTCTLGLTAGAYVRNASQAWLQMSIECSHRNVATV